MIPKCEDCNSRTAVYLFAGKYWCIPCFDLSQRQAQASAPQYGGGWHGFTGGAPTPNAVAEEAKCEHAHVALDEAVQLLVSNYAQSWQDFLARIERQGYRIVKVKKQ